MKYLILLSLIVLASCKAQVEEKVQEPTLEKATVVTYENLQTADFAKAIENEDVIVLDVRTSAEIADGKIDGAMELDFYETDFADRLLSMDKDKDYYIYCKGGGRSAKACRLMIENGFKNVHNLDGGYTDWKKNLPE